MLFKPKKKIFPQSFEFRNCMWFNFGGKYLRSSCNKIHFNQKCSLLLILKTLFVQEKQTFYFFETNSSCKLYNFWDCILINFCLSESISTYFMVLNYLLGKYNRNTVRAIGWLGTRKFPDSEQICQWTIGKRCCWFDNC